MDNPSVHPGVGILLIVGASGVGAFLVFGPAWRSMPAGPAIASVAACGAAIAAGGLLLQEDVGPASWVVALVALGILAPVHARLVFGPPGAARGVVAPGPTAA